MTKKISFKKTMVILALALLLIVAFAPLAKADYWYFTEVYSKSFSHNFTSQYLSVRARYYDGTKGTESLTIKQSNTWTCKLDYIERSFQGGTGTRTLLVTKGTTIRKSMSGRVEYA